MVIVSKMRVIGQETTKGAPNAPPPACLGLTNDIHFTEIYFCLVTRIYIFIS